MTGSHAPLDEHDHEHDQSLGQRHALEHDQADHHAHQDDHGHEHAHEHGHEHAHGHSHDHDHDHPHGGLKGFLYDLFVPHSHDAADSIDDAMEASSAGVRVLKVSLVIMLATTILQAVIAVATNSVALLADTVHNLADALTAVPLWIAFVLGRRAATRRFTYGYGRAEDLAGLVIVLAVAGSAVVAGWESVRRLVSPSPMHHPWVVMVAGLIGFAGNEAVAIYRTRVGRRIGSAALVADGMHARVDGFTSLAVVIGAIGTLAGVPVLDPIIGIVIAASIVVLLVGTVRSVGERLLDAVDPEQVVTVEHALGHVEGVRSVDEVRLRWVGHRLQGEATVTSTDTTLDAADRTRTAGEREVREHLPYVERFDVRVRS